MKAMVINMFEKLELIEKRFEEINERLMDPDVVSDPEEYKKLMKEYKNLTVIVEKFREYKKAREAFDEAHEMLEAGGLDPELKEMAQEQFDEGRTLMDRYTDELRILLLPKDPNDDKNVIVEIRGGAGGDEAALFAGDLYRMYTMYAESKGWKVEVINLNDTELGGIKEVSFSIDGDGAYSRLKFESGVHRVQRVPETESQGRVHTSTVTVSVLPEVEDVEFELNPADLEFEAFRSGGAGGQNVNKVSSAVRMTHIPSGLVVSCQTERSQLQNRENCMKMLRAKLLEMKQREQDDKIASERRAQVGTGDRSERIRTYNFPQGRLTDHRIGYTSYQLEQNMNGNLDELIDALITADQALKLAAAEG